MREPALDVDLRKLAARAELRHHAVAHDVDRNAARHLAGVVAAHAVGQHGDPRVAVDEDRIFVVRADHPRMGQARDIQGGGFTHAEGATRNGKGKRRSVAAWRARREPRGRAPVRTSRHNTVFRSLPISAGLRVTLMPEASITCELFLRRALAAGDDRARVSHPLARRRGHARDEADDRLFHVVLRPQRGGLLVAAADLADHHHGVGVRIVVEQLEHVDVLQAVDRVAADADRGRLPEAELGELPDRFVGERSRARHDADAALLVDVAGHDADLDLVGRDDAGTVGAEQQRLLPLHAVRGSRSCRARGCPR